jgi:hypothetical protein
MAKSANHKGLRRELSRTIGAAIFAKNVKIFSIRNQPASLAIKILIRPSATFTPLSPPVNGGIMGGV